MSLEDRIRELARKGELTYLSVIPHAGRNGEIIFSATYSPAKKWGHSYGEDADPVLALEKAMSGKVKIDER
jgi:hypothetical protein